MHYTPELALLGPALLLVLVVMLALYPGWAPLAVAFALFTWARKRDWGFIEDRPNDYDAELAFLRWEGEFK